MFQGSKHHDTEYFGPIEKVGAEINGSTDNDRTNYYETLPSNALELALCRSRPHGVPAPGAHAGQARQPARRGEERAARERRQPALRPLGREARRGVLPAGPPLSPPRDRLDGRPSPRASPTSRPSSARTTPRTTRAFASRATSTSRRRRRSSKSTSARSPAAPRSPE
ncbi:MAG: hypothetical protein U0835_13005 [Isosphaeraceae bacterium]